MNFKSIIIAIWLLLSADILCAQTDTTKVETVEVDRGTIRGDVENDVIPSNAAQLHSPRKATWMSVALPGLGQAYNKKYWKIPILYGGFAVAGYYLNDNLTHIREYKNDYIAETDDNPETINNSGYNTAQLELLIDQYKNWRDLSYIAIGAIYLLNIIDASVDAHLFYFDVSEDISMNIQPYLNPIGNTSAGLVLSLKL